MAAAGVASNSGIDQFALVHGVTVATMARVVLEWIDEPGRSRLEAAVTGFVVAAIIAFDTSRRPTAGSAMGEIELLADKAAELAAG